jgi:hypothetical protein
VVWGFLPILGFAAVGALILSRRPHNVIGWLCWAIGFTWSLAALGGDPAARRIGADSVPILAALALQLGQVAFLLSLLGLLPLLVLLFPTGRLPSRRWRPIVWIFAAGLLLYAASRVLQPGQLHDELPATNPLGLESADDVLQLIGAALFWLFALLVVLVLGSLVLRFRRSRGEERQQLRWLTYGAALLAVLLPTVGGMVERIGPPFLGEVFFALALSMVPAAIGVAVLRYRLYDIDRIINRTLVYGLLTALLAGIYAIVVLILGLQFGAIGGRAPSWVVAAATLAVAALFQPGSRPQNGPAFRFCAGFIPVARDLLY